MYIRDLLSLRLPGSRLQYLKSILTWISGFFLGSLVAGSANPLVFSLMLRAIQTPMSIDGLLTAYFLPFLLSVAALHLNRRSWLLAVCFIKAFTYAYLAGCFVISFHSAWLLLPLFFFSDLYTGILLLWIYAHDRPSKIKLSALLPVILTVIAASLDFFLISPLLVTIVD